MCNDENTSNDQPDWDSLRSSLELGQRLTGSVALVPRPGAVGIVIDLGLPVQGFVDVLLLPFDVGRWPIEGTVTDFLIWWMDPKKAQIRLVPAKAMYRREDFDTWCLSNAPAGNPKLLAEFDFES
ncbi:hypothetical protein [Nocardia sp. NPDC050435]|uniref:hypothetical protein n=1 Tax=Nocardia sp. NPDC050435 TaxID=3155040 RepID=UPI0033FE5667